jgi:hypothetical protein
MNAIVPTRCVAAAGLAAELVVRARNVPASRAETVSLDIERTLETGA